MDIQAPSGRMAGNRDSVNLLKKWLKEAKRGSVGHVAIAVAMEPGAQIYTESVGSVVYQEDMCRALDDLRGRIHEQVSRRFAPVNKRSAANCVTYNVSTSVVCFDFLPWLIGAEMYRVRHGAPAPLKVAFYHVEQENVGVPQIQIQMLQRVAGPLVSAIGGIISPFVGGRGDFSIGYNQIVAAHKHGESVPKLRPSNMAVGAVDALLDGLPQPVTITLREADHYDNRNSNVQAWIKFAGDLRDKGEYVVFLRDTAKAEQEIDGFATVPIASEDLHFRLALYDRAKTNLFVSNGPATLNYHLDAPFLMFTEIDFAHKGDYECAFPEWWPRAMGIEVGEQFPWFNARQRIVWKTDSYENLSAAWEEFNG